MSVAVTADFTKRPATVSSGERPKPSLDTKIPKTVVLKESTEATKSGSNEVFSIDSLLQGEEEVAAKPRTKRIPSMNLEDALAMDLTNTAKVEPPVPMQRRDSKGFVGSRVQNRRLSHSSRTSFVVPESSPASAPVPAAISS